VFGSTFSIQTPDRRLLTCKLPPSSADALRTDVDCNFFILSVDLWDAEGKHEQNLVMHPSNATAAALAGSSANSPTSPNTFHQPSWTNSSPAANSQYSYQTEYPPNSSFLPPAHGSNQNYQTGYPSTSMYAGSDMHPGYAGEDIYSAQHSQGGGSFTRNLIGSLTASAFRLKDDKDVPGIWFILQDLSVRTEGTFRLKFSFLNLGVYVLRLLGLKIVHPKLARIEGRACRSTWASQRL
jgi:hypothetical protein